MIVYLHAELTIRIAAVTRKKAKRRFGKWRVRGRALIKKIDGRPRSVCELSFYQHLKPAISHSLHLKGHFFPVHHSNHSGIFHYLRVNSITVFP